MACAPRSPTLSRQFSRFLCATGVLTTAELHACRRMQPPQEPGAISNAPPDGAENLPMKSLATHGLALVLGAFLGAIAVEAVMAATAVEEAAEALKSISKHGIRIELEMPPTGLDLNLGSQLVTTPIDITLKGN